MELSPVNERIKKFLKQTGLTQEVFAAKIGCAQQQISSAVTNKYQPGLDLLTGILVAFPAVSSDWLVLGNGEMMKGEVPGLSQREDLKKSDESSKCEACKKLNIKIELLDDLLNKRDAEIARLNQEIGQLKLNQIEPKKGKVSYE